MLRARISIRQKLALGAGVVLLLSGLALLWLALTGAPNPKFEGKRVSSWFDDLCSGVFGGTPRAAAFGPAYEAFTRINADAVPYLAQQLKYGRSGLIEKILLRFKNLRLTAPLLKFTLLPSARREYAAVALRRMGDSAESAVPALLEAWKNDKTSVKVNCIAALAAILHIETPDGLSPLEWKVLEAEVVRSAARKFPNATPALGIDLELKLDRSEPSAASNSRQ